MAHVHDILSQELTFRRRGEAYEIVDCISSLLCSDNWNLRRCHLRSEKPRIMVLPEFAWIADRIFDLARATCSAKCMIRADWSLVSGLKARLSPTQAKGFQVARCHTMVAQPFDS